MTINVVQKDDLYEVSFKYDSHVVYLVKTVYGRKYIPERKVWTIPKSSLGYLINAFQGTPYETCLNVVSDENINVNSTLDSTTEIPEVDISKIHKYVKKGCKLYQHQLDFLKYAINRQNCGIVSGMILADEPGCGKALSLDTRIYTPTGYKLMKDIEVGDEVFNESGEVVNVLATYDHKELNMYKVTFDDGTSVNCCEDHLWTFYLQQGFVTWPLKKILNGSKYGPKYEDWHRRIKEYWIPRIQPVPFNAQEVYINPWLLGILIGEGSLGNGAVEFTTTYDDIIEEVYRALPDGYELSNFGIEHRIIHSGSHAYNEVLRYIKKLGLDKTSREKFIPDIYKYNSIENRWALLQGLMDSDGYAAKENCHTYTTTSKQLAYDVLWLAESLGGYGHLTAGKSQYRGKYCGESYDITMRFDDARKLYRASKHKLERAHERHFKPRKHFKDIEYLGKMPGKCITVSGKNKLYLCNHFIPTHNTVEGLNLALYNKTHHNFKRCLIICCVNPAKWHWKRDVQDHTNGVYDPYILGTRIAKRSGEEVYQSSSKNKLEDLQTLKMYGDKKGKTLPYFIVMNIEALRMSEGRKRPITDAIIDLINKGEISMIIIDEVHKNMSPSSIQGKQIDRIKKSTGNKVEWIPMTGTPIVNKPTDVYLPLKLVGGHDYKSFYTWAQEYCLYGGFGGKEIVGYKNIPQLKACLQNNMIRRKKEDVLDLPPKVFKTEYVENTSYQQKMYDEIRTGLIQNRDEILASLNPLSQFTRLRQVNECPEIIDSDLKVDPHYLSKNAKLKRLIEILDDIQESGEKVIVFSNWVKPLETLYELIHKKYHVCCFTGTMSETLREKHKQTFISDPKYTILLGTIGALGTMHTFTVAKNAIFLDLPWTMADFEQACDRIHRIGTTTSVNIYKMITKDTIDERINDILYEKAGISNYIVDNIDIHDNPKLFDMLLGIK